MWPDLIQKAKEGGLDVIQTYVFWNGHEPQPGKVTNITSLFFLSIFVNLSNANMHMWVFYIYIYIFFFMIVVLF